MGREREQNLPKISYLIYLNHNKTFHAIKRAPRAFFIKVQNNILIILMMSCHTCQKVTIILTSSKFSNKLVFRKNFKMSRTFEFLKYDYLVFLMNYYDPCFN